MSSERERLHEGLCRLAVGERDAFDDVFPALWRLFLAFTRRHVRSEDAEDVAQQALVNVFARCSELDPSRDAVAWALGVVAWEVRSQRRRSWRRREEPLPEGSVSLDPQPGPEHALALVEQAALLDEALATLSSEDREALLAHAEDRRPAGDRFRKRLQRAVARLRAAWRPNHDG